MIYRVFCVCMTLLLAGLVLSSCSEPAEQETKPELKRGISYLEQLEQKDPAQVRDAIADIAEMHLEEKREQFRQEIISGERDVWGFFKDAVILGDSRAVGFGYYKYLPWDQVLAVGGENIFRVKDHYEEIRQANPSYIYLCYGINDIIFWDGAEDYRQGFGEMLTDLHNEFPKATIIVSSILPVIDPAFEKEDEWYQVPDYSAAVGEFCHENGFIFADNDQLCQEHMDLYGPDGIHLYSDFYPYWARNLVLAMLEGTGEVDRMAEAESEE